MSAVVRILETVLNKPTKEMDTNVLTSKERELEGEVLVASSRIAFQISH